MRGVRRGVWLAALLVGCRSLPAPAPAIPCRAVGRFELEAGGERMAATAVLHVAAADAFALRLVDPAGRTLADFRVDGAAARFLDRDRGTVWDGPAGEALARLLGIAAPPARVLGWLRGRAGEGEWTVRAAAAPCLAPRATVEGHDRAGRLVRMQLEWDGIEPWPEAVRSLGPAPAGALPTGELPTLVSEGRR